jgi:anti-sigma factor RsiW
MATETNDHVSELLPWYANGTLAPDQRSAIDRHLAACARCRAELDWLRQLGTHVQASRAPAEGDLGLARFLDGIARDSNVVPLRRPQRPRWVAPAFALAASLLVAQTVTIGVLLKDREAVLETLAGPAAASGTLLQVTFAPHATQAQISALLAAVEARIVDGPGALGVYTLSVAPAGADTAIRELEKAKETVASVARMP